MVNKNFYRFILVALILFPTIIFSANIEIETKSNVIHVGDTVVIDVVMDTEKTTLNLVEGSINIGGSPSVVEVLEVSLSGSSLTLWPGKPSVTADGSTISFVGGTPNGFNSSKSVLFKVVLVARSAGKVVLSPAKIKAYINDGKGTIATVRLNSTEIDIIVADKNVQPINDWSTILSEDKTPPEKFSITLGQDASVYDNQKFISFYAEDLDSGVDYYEVKEGDFEKVRSSNTYVLKEQDKDQVILVSAVDKAGNIRNVEFRSSEHSKNIKAAVFFAVLFFSVLFIIARMFKGYYKVNKN